MDANYEMDSYAWFTPDEARENIKKESLASFFLNAYLREEPEEKKDKIMIKNVVFDIGNVLADFRIKEFLMEKGLDLPTIKRVIKASVMNPYWGKFERGEVTEEETLQAFAAADPEIEEELRLAFSNLSGMLVIRDYAIPLVQNLKRAGYGVYYLSNYSKKAYDECGESLAFMPYMDGGIVSFKVGMTKPDEKVFACFLERYDLMPESCLFIDDTEENVEAAKKLGFPGIVFHSYDDMMEELKKAGVNIQENQKYRC